MILFNSGSTHARALSGKQVAQIARPVRLAPDLAGTVGQAWLCDLNAVRRKAGVGGAVGDDKDGCIAHWLIEAPWAHPIRHTYSLAVVHLRPMGKPIKFYMPNATHELWLYATHPDFDREKAIAGGNYSGMWLEPINFSAQFVEISDDLARARARAAVQLVCEGKLNPDTDFVSQWIALFGNNMRKDRPNPRPPIERM